MDSTDLSSLPTRRLLMVALRYPPQEGVGIIRSCKFEKYLPDHGWTADVLTGPARRPAAPISDEPSQLGPGQVFRVDHSDLRGRAGAIEARLTGTPLSPLGRMIAKAIRRYSATFLVPDESRPFFEAVQRRGAGRWKQRDYDAVYSSAMPWTDHLVAAWIAEEIGVPLVLDFRDPWIESEGVRNSGRRYRREVAMEAQLIRQATLVLCTATGLRDDFMSRFPDLPEKRFQVIYNGYDEQDFAELEKSDAPKFRIAHTGTFYGSKGPEPLFRALAELVERRSDLRSRVVLQLVGRARPKDRELARSIGVDDLVEFVGRVSHREALQFVVDADLLVAVDFQGEQARMRVISKSFEYLRSGRPILFLSDGSETETILGNSGRARIIPKFQTSDVARALEQEITQRRETVPVDDATRAFSRHAQAGELAAKLDRLVTG